MQSVRVIIVCDRCGAEHPARGGYEPARFAIGGLAYEIDLCPDDAKAMAETMRPFIDAGRRIRTWGGSTEPRRARRSTATRRTAAYKRAWAKGHGWPDLSTHGRIPAEALAAFEEAHR